MTIPRFERKARDWEVACLPQVGGVAVVGGGMFWFKFRSPSQEVTEPFAFVGLGGGAGGSFGGGSLTPGSWTALECDNDFCVYDLHGAMGRLTTGGISLVAGYALTFITAWTWDGTLFSQQSVSGFTAGVSQGVACLLGCWDSKTLMAERLRRASR